MTDNRVPLHVVPLPIQEGDLYMTPNASMVQVEYVSVPRPRDRRGTRVPVAARADVDRGVGRMRRGDLVLHRNGGRFVVTCVTLGRVFCRNPVRGRPDLEFRRQDLKRITRS